MAPGPGPGPRERGFDGAHWSGDLSDEDRWGATAAPPRTARTAGRNGAGRNGAPEEAAAAAAAPGSGARAGGSGFGDDGFGGWASPRGRGVRDAPDGAAPGPSGEEYGDEFGDEWAGGSGQRGGGGGTEGPGDFAGAGTEDGAGDGWAGSEAQGRRYSTPPNITALTANEVDSILPLAGTGDQYTYYWGTWEKALQRVSLAMVVSLCTSTASPTVAATAFSYIFWGPVASAVARNFSVRKFPHGGLWHANVLDTKVVQRFPDDIKESPNRTRPSRPIDMLQLFIGDRSKAQVMIETPWTLQHNRIRLGEPVELVVVSDVRNLQRFKVVRDAFLPASQLWISDYPFLARSEMKQLVRGIQVERSR